MLDRETLLVKKKEATEELKNLSREVTLTESHLLDVTARAHQARGKLVALDALLAETASAKQEA